MKSKRTLAAGLLFAALIAITIACEDTDLTAPSGSTITLNASPGNVYIDEAAGEQEGQTTLYAQVIDSGGVPVREIPLVFSSDSGLLGSVDNVCKSGQCSRSAGVACVVSADCPVLPPASVETNDNGIATDTLTLRRLQDLDSVVVTVRGTNLETTTTVRKLVNLTIPLGSTISLIASPGSVFIDQDADETEGQTAMVAQVIDDSGVPLRGVPLLFSTDGGLLATVNNVCTDTGTCSRSPDFCWTAADCPVIAPEVVVTDQNGFANDILTLRLFADPDAVTVTVKGSTLQTTRTVTKTVNTGPVDPVAVIIANPAVGQRTGRPFQLDGSGSTFDPQVEPECYDWTIVSNKRVFDPSNGTDGIGCQVCPTPGTPACAASCTDRGPTRSVLTLQIGDEGDETLDQTLAITLQVSDEPTIVCSNFAPVDDNKLSQFKATANYLVLCDLTDPQLEAGGNRFASLANDANPQGEVTFTFTPAVATDPEDPELDYTWECGNPQNEVFNTRTATCTYTTEGTFTVTLTVVNDCNRFSQDSLIVQINP